MSDAERSDRLANDMRAAFEAELPHRIARATRVELQQFIPAHWFAAAASECASMYIAGFFYGAISVAQAYVEALSLFLAENRGGRVAKDPLERWRRLHREKVVSQGASEAAISVLTDRNDFHHLNKQIEQEFLRLEARAEECVNNLHRIESEVFAYGLGGSGKITLQTPGYWPSGDKGLTQVNLRQLW